MLDLLKRISARGYAHDWAVSPPSALDSESARSSVGAASQHPSEGMLPAARRPTNWGFPAAPRLPTPAGSESVRATSARDDSIWAECVAQAQTALLSPPKNAWGFGAFHAAIGRILWQERASFTRQPIHFEHRGVLLSVLDPDLATAQLRSDVLDRLNQKQAEPASSLGRATNLTKRGGAAASSVVRAVSFRALPMASKGVIQSGGTQTCNAHDLIWHYAQTCADAMDAMPAALVAGPMEIRRFPRVRPKMMGARHLALIHTFSAGPLGLVDVQAFTDPENRAWLACDLMGLFLTGALRAAPIARL